MNQLEPVFLNRVRNYISQGYSYELAYKYACEEAEIEAIEDKIAEKQLNWAKKSMNKLRFYRK